MKRDPRQRLLDLKRETTLPVVAVSHAEKQMAKDLAESRHTTMAEMIRQLLYEAADKLKKGKAA